MPDEIIIEQLKLSDKDKIIPFLQRAYDDNPRMSDARFWDWHFLETPHARVDNLSVWIARSGEEIGGQLAATPVVVNLGGERRDAIWILDLIVAPEFRRKGLAKKLIRAAEEFCPLVLGVNTKEQFSTQLLEGLDYKIILNIHRFHKLLYAGNDVHKIAKIGFLRETVNAAFAPFRRRFKKNENVRAVENFDASFDELWAEAETQWTCAVRRDREFLEWQFINQPAKKYDIISYYEGEKLLGYVVLYFRKPDTGGIIRKAAIADICYHPNNSKEVVDALLRESLRRAVERRAGGLVTDVLDDLIEERLEKLGFWRVKSPLQFLLKSPQNQDLLYNPKNWFLTRGDSDTSIFEAPNL
jgi:GNAT superfamily N-acetyltransferase